MASTVTITIPSPTLGGSDYFIVKYRLLGAISWTDVAPDPTNAPFTISGLSDGDYELSINISTAPDDPALIQCFTVTTDCICPEIYNKTFTETSGVRTIAFDLNLADSGFPPCGFNMVLTDSTGSITTVLVHTIADLTQIIASPFVADQFGFEAIVTDDSYTVDVYINCCDGENGQPNITLCEEYTIQLAGYPDPCIPIDVPSATVVFDTPTQKWYLWIYVVIYTPCDTMDVGWSEVVTWFTGSPPDIGTATVTGIMSLPVSGGRRIIKVELDPSPDDTLHFYHGSVTDCCGIQHNF